MKKIILCGPDLGAVSGVSTHLNHLFASDLRQDFNLVHFQVGSEGRGEAAIGKLMRLLMSPFQFASRILSERPDAVLLNTSLEPKAFWRDLAYLIIAKSLRTPIIYQVHGGELPETFLGRGRLAQWFTQKCLAIPNIVVLLAEIERQSYERYSGIKEIVVIPNAIDVSVFEHIEGKEFNRNQLIFGYIGRLAHDKGIVESIEALKLIKDSEDLDIRYVIAGSGPSEPTLRNLVDTLDLSDRVSFLAPVFGKDKVQFWTEIDVFLFPTYHREGLPYTILEAMASATPTITSEVGGIPDVISDNIQGVFVDPHSPDAIASAIRRFVSNKDPLISMSVNAKKRALEHYTIERLAAQFRDVFNKVVTR